MALGCFFQMNQEIHLPMALSLSILEIIKSIDSTNNYRKPSMCQALWAFEMHLWINK